MSKFSVNFAKFFSLFVFGIILFSIPVSVFAKEPPKPGWVTLQNNGQTDTTIPIAWSPVAGADHYKVFYKSSNDALFTEITINNVTSTTITNLIPGTVYTIKVQACNTDGCSTDVVSKPITTKSAAPAGGVAPAAPAGGVAPAAGAPQQAVIPELQKIFGCNPVNPANCQFPIIRPGWATNFSTLSDFVSGILNIAFFVAIFLAFYFLVWGAFQYIMAQGKKEELGKARARITWAIIGLIIILLSYSIAKFASEIFTPDKGGLPF